MNKESVNILSGDSRRSHSLESRSNLDGGFQNIRTDNWQSKWSPPLLLRGKTPSDESKKRYAEQMTRMTGFDGDADIKSVCTNLNSARRSANVSGNLEGTGSLADATTEDVIKKNRRSLDNLVNYERQLGMHAALEIRIASEIAERANGNSTDDVQNLVDVKLHRVLANLDKARAGTGAPVVANDERRANGPDARKNAVMELEAVRKACRSDISSARRSVLKSARQLIGQILKNAVQTRSFGKIFSIAKPLLTIVRISILEVLRFAFETKLRMAIATAILIAISLFTGAYAMQLGTLLFLPLISYGSLSMAVDSVSRLRALLLIEGLKRQAKVDKED
jgi:hypothetical protein